MPEVKIVVRDTGIGIDAANQRYIFDKFRQVDSAEHRVHSGSGLGLALARNLVEMHGGSIEVESQVGQGSTFIIVLPVIAKGC
jgi:signal transduction histidine kinase